MSVGGGGGGGSGGRGGEIGVVHGRINTRIGVLLMMMMCSLMSSDVWLAY